MIGVLEDISKRVTMSFKDEGDLIVLLGETRDELGGSEYLKVIHGLETGRPRPANAPIWSGRARPTS